MKKIIKKLKRRNKVIVALYFITSILFLFSATLFIKNLLYFKGVETIIRVIIIILIIVGGIFSFMKNLMNIIERKYKRNIISFILTILFSLCLLFSAEIFDVIYKGIGGFNEKNKVVYTTKLITLNHSKFDKKSTIGMIDDPSDITGYILGNKLIEEKELNNKIVEYDNYIKMLHDLYEGKIDSVIVSSNYKALYSSEEGFEDINSDVIEIYSYSEKRTNTDYVSSSNKGFEEPLTFLIMGVDSEDDGLDENRAFNGDTLMLITFNPKTLNATMLSLPRDIMVPISCNNDKIYKINSSAVGGTSCAIDTITNLTGIDIDYYAKINFKGVVDLVDALGGIEVDVEKPDYDKYDGKICEQNSDREFGKNLICIEPGLQTLNGEEALAYARNRKLFLLSDIDRIRHQQQVVTAIANKAVTIRSINDFKKILNAVNKNVSINMSTEQILSSYTVFKDMAFNAINKESFINIEKSYLEYYNLRAYIPTFGKETSAIGYYNDSLNDIIKQMEINLEKTEPKIIKTFSYKIDEKYESYVSGKNFKKEKTYTALENLVGKKKEEVEKYCKDNELKCSFTIVDSNSEYYNKDVKSNLISFQSEKEKTLLTYIKEVKFYINGEVIEEP